MLEGDVVQKLIEKGIRVTTAESCTGGLIASRLVNVSGVSAVFEEGYITYSNEAKHKLLGVHTKTLEKYGAVSAQTAGEMAEGAVQRANAQASLAVTGIAGPDGGTAEKPVGLVYIGCNVEGRTEVQKNLLQGNRTEIRNQTADKALELLLKMLQET